MQTCKAAAAAVRIPDMDVIPGNHIQVVTDGRWQWMERNNEMV
jgi:hypothetical protein